MVILVLTNIKRIIFIHVVCSFLYIVTYHLCINLIPFWATMYKNDTQLCIKMNTNFKF